MAFLAAVVFSRSVASLACGRNLELSFVRRDLKEWVLKIAGKGKKKAKRRTVVAVARKLAILLRRLWVGQPYEQHRRRNQAARAAA
jgi:hypothetical protein